MEMDFGSSLFGTLYQNQEAKRAAKRQMEFQDRMSSTAYQRAMADMKKAGLNPMLAMKLGGASTPTGASYNPQNVGAAAVEGASKGAQRRLANAQAQTQVNTAKGMDIDNKIKQRTLDDLQKRNTTIEMYKNRWQNLAGSEVYAAITKNIGPEEIGNYIVALLSGDWSQASEIIKRASSNSKDSNRNMQLNREAINIMKRGNYKYNRSGRAMKQYYSYNKDNMFAYEYKKYQHERKNR